MRRRWSAATRSSTTSRRRAGRRSRQAQLEGGPRRAGRARRRPAARRSKRAALHVAGPPPARDDPRRRGRRSRPAATRSSRRSTGTPSSSPRSWLGGRGDRPEPEPRQSRETSARRAQDPARAIAPGSTRCAARTSTTASLVAIDYRTGDVLAYAGSAGYYRGQPGQPEVRARSTTPPATAPASPARLGSRSSTRPPSTAKRLTPGSLLLDITTEFNRRRGLGAARRRPARPRAGPRPQGAPVLAQHPGDPGPPAGRQRGGRRRPAEALGHPLHRRPQGLPPGRAGGRDRDGRGPAARPDLGLRRASPTAASACRPG